MGTIPGPFSWSYEDQLPLIGRSSEAVSKDGFKVFLRKQLWVDYNTENGQGDFSLNETIPQSLGWVQELVVMKTLFKASMQFVLRPEEQTSTAKDTE